jgi:hypothetical protein
MLLLLRQNEFEFHSVAFNGAGVGNVYARRRLVSPVGAAMLTLKSSTRSEFAIGVDQQRL